jgi:hypothetical protein
MRPIHLSDFDVMVRVLLQAPAETRAPLAAKLVHAADIGDRYRKKLRRIHPLFGDGTLTSAAQEQPRRAHPRHCDRSYRACLQIVLAALAEQGRQDIA